MVRILVLVLGCLLSANALTQSTSASKEALDVIADFADRLCKSVPLNGHTSSVELSGTAKAELAGVIKKISDLGIEGAGRYQSDSYQSVLQKDLAGLLQDYHKCRIQVWNDLKDKFQIGSHSTSSRSSELQREIVDLENQIDRMREEQTRLLAKWQATVSDSQNRNALINRLRSEQSRIDTSSSSGHSEYERISRQISLLMQQSPSHTYTSEDADRAGTLRTEIQRQEKVLAARHAELESLSSQ